MSAGAAARPLVVITDCDHDSIEPERRVIEDAGFELRLERCSSSAEVAERAAHADGLLVQYAPIDARALDGVPNCKVVVRYGVGVDTVDVEAAGARGIWVANVPDYGVEEVSDHALAMLLGLLRGIPRLDRSVRAGSWDVRAVRPLGRVSRLTVGVVGLGRIGSAFARKVSCLGVRVIAHDPAGVPPELARAGVRAVELPELLAQADAVSLHVPLTEATRHLVGAPELARMRPHAVLVNTARGGLVDSRALLHALDRGQIAGAALDVLEEEPPPEGDPLVTHPRALVTPHAAWYSEDAYETLKTEAAREVVRVLSGGRPRSPVNDPAPVGRSRA